MKRYPVRPKKNYVWVTQGFTGGFDASDILPLDLVDGSDFLPAVLSSREFNLQRIIVKAVISVHTNDIDTEELFVYGASDYVLYIRDTDEEVGTVDPSAPADIADEIILGAGQTDIIGHLATDSAFVGGTGTNNAYGTAIQPWCRLDLDIRTNRKISAGQLLTLALTRNGDGGISVLTDHSYIITMLSRVLVKLP